MATDAYSFVQRVWKNGEIFLFYGWWIGYGHFGTKQDTKRKRVTKNKTLNLSDCGTLLYGCYILPFDRFATKQNGNFISIILYTHQRYASTPHTHTHCLGCLACWFSPSSATCTHYELMITILQAT